MAQQQPEKFYIGIDANTCALEKISEKIHRKPAKGGLPNALFLQAAAEDLPAELAGLAQEVHVQFPWGSLLSGVLTGEERVLNNLHRLCAPGASLQIITGLDPERDHAEFERLGLPVLSNEYLATVLAPRYCAAGFCDLKKRMLPPAAWADLASSWAKRLRNNPARDLVCLTARIA